MGNTSCTCQNDPPYKASGAEDAVTGALENGSGQYIKDVSGQELFARLSTVEGDRKAEDALFDEYHSQGACMIATVEFSEDNKDRLLIIYKFLRALFMMEIWDEHVKLVKSDGPRFFTFCSSSSRALKAAFAMKRLVSKLDTWMDEVCPEVGPLKQPPTIKVGIHYGWIILVDGDCYGDPVNVASKLGEDIANPGEILVSSFAVATGGSKMIEVIAQCVSTGQQTDIAGLTLVYFITEAKNLIAIAPGAMLPVAVQVSEFMKASDYEPPVKTHDDLTIMTTDMSGFTRLTKEYGICHFLRLILKARTIVLPAMKKVQGDLIKYEGDNIIACFPSAVAALACVKSCQMQIEEYNKTRTKDFHLRIGFGLADGTCTIIPGHDIIGPAYDRSFVMAEDLAEVGEVLITERVKALGYPSVQAMASLSEARPLVLDAKPLGGQAARRPSQISRRPSQASVEGVEGAPVMYHVMKFL